MDNFFSHNVCDRFGCYIKGRTHSISLFNYECICESCKKEELALPIYDEATKLIQAYLLKEKYNI